MFILMQKPEFYTKYKTVALVFLLFTVYENCYAVHVKRTYDGELLY